LVEQLGIAPRSAAFALELNSVDLHLPLVMKS